MTQALVYCNGCGQRVMVDYPVDREHDRCPMCGKEFRYGYDVVEYPGPNATEKAVELALEHGIELADVAGSGAGGRVVVADVRDHLAALAAQSEEE